MKKIGKILSVLMTASLSLFAISCVRDKEDKDAPAEVSDFAVKAENGTAVLTWTNPEDSDFAGTKLSMSPAISELAEEKTLETTVTTFTVTGLTDGESYTFTIKTFDKSGNTSQGKTIGDSVKDTVAPAEVSNFKVIAENQKASLSWTNPADEDFDGVKITITKAGEDSVEEKTLTKDDTSLDLTGLTNGITYTFKIQAVDKSGNPSDGLSKADVPWDNTSFVRVAGGTIEGKTNENNYEGVFIKDRTVTLSDFYIGKYEVTQEEYESVMKDQKVKVGETEYDLASKPSYCSEGSTTYALDIKSLGEEQGRRPVEGVTWYDAVYFCNAKSEKEGLTPAYGITVTSVSDNHITAADVTYDKIANGYRLPTEAEWEYAARGGDTSKDDWNYTFSGADTASGTSYSSSSNSGLDAVGWYYYNNKTGATTTDAQANVAAGKGTHEVDKKAANRLGLYDMSGNVWEWCYDGDGTISTGTEENPVGALSGAYRVKRGGSWSYDAYFESVCYRDYSSPNRRSGNLGFRLVRASS